MKYFQQGRRAHAEAANGHDEDSQVDILAMLLIGA